MMCIGGRHVGMEVNSSAHREEVLEGLRVVQGEVAAAHKHTPECQPRLHEKKHGLYGTTHLHYDYPFYFVPWLAGLEGHLQLGRAQELGTTTHESHTAPREGERAHHVRFLCHRRSFTRGLEICGTYTVLPISSTYLYTVLTRAP